MAGTPTRASSIGGTVGIRVVPIFDGVNKALVAGAEKDGRDAGEAYAKSYAKSAGDRISINKRQQAVIEKAMASETAAVNNLKQAEADLDKVRKNSKVYTLAEAEVDLSNARKKIHERTNLLASAEESLAEARKLGNPQAVGDGEAYVAMQRRKLGQATSEYNEIQSKRNFIEQHGSMQSAEVYAAEERVMQARKEHEGVLKKYAAAFDLKKRAEDQDLADADKRARADFDAISRRQRMAASIRNHVQELGKEHRAFAALDSIMGNFGKRRVGVDFDDSFTTKFQKAINSFDDLNMAVSGNMLKIGTWMHLIPVAASALVPLAAGLTAVAGAAGMMGAGLVAGAGVGVLALKPVIGALQALSNADKQSAMESQAHAKAVQNAQRQIASAKKGVADADRAGSEAVRSAMRSERTAIDQIAIARQAVVRATQSATDQNVAALARQKRAEEAVTQAQRDQKQAQLDLIEARKSAEQQLEDLSSRVEDSALSIREAEASTMRARESLSKTNADPKASSLDRIEAQNAYDRAVLNEKRIRTEAKRTADEAAEARRKGINGSKEVLAANQRIADSQQKIKDAEAGYRESIEDTRRTRQQGAEAIKAAEESVTRAKERANEAHAEVERARKERLDRIAEANLRLKDAQQALTDTNSKLTSSQNAVNQAMDQLSPKGIELVKRLKEITAAQGELSKKSQERMFPGLLSFIDSMETKGPGFERTVLNISSVLGNLAEDAGQALNGPEWTKIISNWERTLPDALNSGARTIGNVTTGVMTILTAMSPVFEDFAKSIEGGSGSFAKWAAEWVKSDGFHDFLDYIRVNGPRVAEFIGNAARAIVNLAKALAPYGDMVLNGLDSFVKLIANMDTDHLRTAIGVLGVAGGVLATLGFTLRSLKMGADTIKFFKELKDLSRGAKGLESAARSAERIAAAEAIADGVDGGGKGVPGEAAGKKGSKLGKLAKGLGGVTLVGGAAYLTYEGLQAQIENDKIRASQGKRSTAEQIHRQGVGTMNGRNDYGPGDGWMTRTPKNMEEITRVYAQRGRAAGDAFVKSYYGGIGIMNDDYRRKIKEAADKGAAIWNKTPAGVAAAKKAHEDAAKAMAGSWSTLGTVSLREWLHLDQGIGQHSGSIKTKTTTDTANATKSVQEKWNTLKTNLGAIFTGTASDVAAKNKGMVDNAQTRMRELGEKFTGAFFGIKTAAERDSSAASRSVTSHTGTMKTNATNNAGVMLTNVSNSFRSIWGKADTTSRDTNNTWSNMWTGLGKKTKAGTDDVTTKVDTGQRNAVLKWSNIFPGIEKPSKQVVDDALNPLANAFNTLAKGLGLSPVPSVVWKGVPYKTPQQVASESRGVNRTLLTGRAEGGEIPSFWSGGYVPGKVPKDGVDNTWGMIAGKAPVNLAGGEWVFSNPATRKIKKNYPGVLEYMNKTGSIPGLFEGGPIPNAPGYVTGGMMDSGTSGGDAAAGSKGNFSAPVPNSGAARAIAFAERAMRGALTWYRWCQRFVNTATGYPFGHFGSARQQMNYLAGRGLLHKTLNPPAGAQVYYETGHSAGHVALADGKGNVYSNDILRHGGIDKVGLTFLAKKWNSPFVGWASSFGPGTGLMASDAGGMMGFTDPKSYMESIDKKATDAIYGGIRANLDKVVLPIHGDATQMTLGTVGKSLIDGAVKKLEESASAGMMPVDQNGENFAYKPVEAGSARAIAQQMAAQRGWTGAQWNAIDQIVMPESGWNPNAANPHSSARGIFQKMTSLHGALEPTIQGQIAWGYKYIADRYGDPLKALAFRRSHNWYNQGGPVEMPKLAWDIQPGTTGHLPPGYSLAYNGTGTYEPLTRGYGDDVTIRRSQGPTGPYAGNTGVIITGDIHQHDDTQSWVSDLKWGIQSKSLSGKYGK